MATVERTLTINVRNKVIKVPAYRRAKKAVTAVREYLQRHMKSDNVKLGKYLNLKIWEHGIKNPVTRITVLAKKDDKGTVISQSCGGQCTQTIQPNASYTWYPPAMSSQASYAGKYGSATLTSSQPLAVIVNDASGKGTLDAAIYNGIKADN